MTSINIPAGGLNTVIAHKGLDYICYTSHAPGSRFYDPNGTDTTSHISNISHATFENAVVCIIDIYDFITDDNHNVFIKVNSYTTQTTTRPTRI